MILTSSYLFSQVCVKALSQLLGQTDLSHIIETKLKFGLTFDVSRMFCIQIKV